MWKVGAALAVALSACATLPRGDLEPGLTVWVRGQVHGHTPILVRCPDDLRNRPGLTFTCDVAMGGWHVPVVGRVAIRYEQRLVQEEITTVTWAWGGDALVDLDVVAETLRSAGETTIGPGCRGVWTIGRTPLECPAIVGGVLETVEVARSDGTFDLRVRP